jgi:hypothetical protein
MKIIDIKTTSDWTLLVTADDGRIGSLDLRPFLAYEAFAPLQDINEFRRVTNGGYFVEWTCGADLSADTIEARWTLVKELA